MPPVVKPPKVDKAKTSHRHDPPGKKLLRNVKFVIDYNAPKNPKRLDNGVPSPVSQ